MATRLVSPAHPGGGKAPGPDELPNLILKNAANEISPFLKIIFDQSPQMGKLLDDWVEVNVAPVFKKEDRHSPANYMPISLTCVCAKVALFYQHHILVFALARLWNGRPMYINKITSKANSTLGFLWRNLKACPPKLRETAYFSLVRSSLEYSSAVWDPFRQKDIDKLENLQRAAARFVT